MTDIINGIDPAHEHWQHRVLRSITAKSAQRPAVDNQGNPLDPDQTPTVYQYDAHGKLILSS